MRHRFVLLAFASIFGIHAPAHAQAVIAPVYDGSLQSYLRLYNAGDSLSTFTVQVVDTQSATTLGAAVIDVPAGASVQHALSAVFAQAGVNAAASNTAVYIRNPDQLAGYQHVTFNAVSALFGNASACTAPMAQQSQRQALTNVHSSRFASTYPSAVTVHNSASAESTVRLTVRDAATGASYGTFTRNVGAHGTVTLSAAEIEAALNIATVPLHYNIEVEGGSLSLAHNIGVARLGGEISMGEVCAVNAPSRSAAPAALPVSVPTAYCGTFRYPSGYTYLYPAPYYPVTHSFLVSLAPNGAMKGMHLSTDRDVKAGGTLSGTSNGTTFSITTSDGTKGSGTVQGDAITGTLQTRLGNVAFTGTTGACN